MTSSPRTVFAFTMFSVYAGPHSTLLQRYHAPASDSPLGVAMYRPGGMDNARPLLGEYPTAYTPSSLYERDDG